MLPPRSEIWSQTSRWRFLAPSWAVSGVLHLLTLVLLGLSLRAATPGAAIEASRPVGIVLRSQEAGETQYWDEASPGEVAPAADEQPVRRLLDEAPAVDPTEALPKPIETLGPGPSTVGPVLGAGELTAAGGGGARGNALGRGSTRVFGLEGNGYKFVYVFDRSGSMGGAGRSALAAAKAELVASLASLEPNHQFQIVFYNDEPQLFRIDDREWRLVFATDVNKELARQFVQSVKADGSTEHERALTLALRLAPDVVFFLTDADQPMLTPTQLRRIAELNSGQCVIHAIEFGLGPSLKSDNFLTQLAGQNGGNHTYIDVSQLGQTSP